LYGNNTILPYCEAVFKIAFLLGGVGKRSRRGFGSLSYSPEISSSMNELPNNLFESLKIIKDDFTLTSGNPIIKRKSSSNYNYPFIKEIYLGDKAFSDSQELLTLIGKASHDQCDRALGNATPRMASPVVVSICKIDSRFFPIITKMNSSFPQGYPRYIIQKQDDFIKQITGV
jgi:CRISPR-associated protein Cmr1